MSEINDEEKESREACDRQAVIVNLNATTKTELMDIKEDNISDDVFDLTLQDLKSMLANLKNVQNEEAFLMTKQMREQEQVSLHSYNIMYYKYGNICDTVEYVFTLYSAPLVCQITQFYKPIYSI